MKVTKFGHCCVLFEENGVRVLTDPGAFSTGQNDVEDVDAVLITHEHPDHLHVGSLKAVLARNPNAKVVTNTTVGALLDAQGIVYEVVEDGQRTEVKGMSVEGFGTLHALMHASMPQSANTGYLIHNTTFYPGDAFTDPHRPIDILALPVAGPWMKLSEAVDYAALLKPRVCFPVHDGIYNEAGSGIVTRLFPMYIEKLGIRFVSLELSMEVEL